MGRNIKKKEKIDLENKPHDWESFYNAIETIKNNTSSETYEKHKDNVMSIEMKARNFLHLAKDKPLPRNNEEFDEAQQRSNRNRRSATSSGIFSKNRNSIYKLKYNGINEIHQLCAEYIKHLEIQIKKIIPDDDERQHLIEELHDNNIQIVPDAKLRPLLIKYGIAISIQDKNDPDEINNFLNQESEELARHRNDTVFDKFIRGIVKLLTLDTRSEGAKLEDNIRNKLNNNQK